MLIIFLNILFFTDKQIIKQSIRHIIIYIIGEKPSALSLIFPSVISDI